MWGHDAKLPLQEQTDYEVDWRVVWKYRRLVRRWCLAQARNMKDEDKRRRSIAAARRMLKCGKPDVSPYRGVSRWLNEDVAVALLDSVEGGEA